MPELQHDECRRAADRDGSAYALTLERATVEFDTDPLLESQLEAGRHDRPEIGLELMNAHARDLLGRRGYQEVDGHFQLAEAPPLDRLVAAVVGVGPKALSA